jgi:hypothetical protein
VVDHDAERQHRKDHDRDCRCVAERDRQQHDGAAAAMQPQRHGEQPAHGRIDAMEEPKSGQREPGLQAAHRARIGPSFRPSAQDQLRVQARAMTALGMCNLRPPAHG